MKLYGIKTHLRCDYSIDSDKIKSKHRALASDKLLNLARSHKSSLLWGSLWEFYVGIKWKMNYFLSESVTRKQLLWTDQYVVCYSLAS